MYQAVRASTAGARPERAVASTTSRPGRAAPGMATLTRTSPASPGAKGSSRGRTSTPQPEAVRTSSPTRSRALP